MIKNSCIRIIASCICIVITQGWLLKEAPTKKPTVLIVLGSAREHSVSEKIALWLKEHMPATITCEIVDLKDVPWVNPEKLVTDQAVTAWQKKVKDSSALIFLAPNYNAGYSGVLKNGLDALGTAAQGKKSALIAYSGGYDGGKEVVDALEPVFKTLGMNMIQSPVLLPMADSAFDDAGDLKKAETIEAINKLINSICTTLY